jgi:hypothetical protein
MKFLEWFKKWNPLSSCFALYLIAMVGDWCSTMLGMTYPGVWETNEIVRDENLRFVLKKALLLDGSFLLVSCLVFYCTYLALAEYSPKLAKLFISAIFLFVAANRLFTAVLPNIAIVIAHLGR